MQRPPASSSCLVYRCEYCTGLSRHRGCVRAYPLVPTVHCTARLSLYPFYFPSKSFCFSRKKIGEGTRNSAGARALLVAIHKLRVVLIVLPCGPSCPSTAPRACRCRIFRHVGRAGVVGSLHWDWDRSGGAALTLPRVTTDPPCWAGEWSARQPACHTNYVRGGAFGISSSTARARVDTNNQ